MTTATLNTTSFSDTYKKVKEDVRLQFNKVKEKLAKGTKELVLMVRHYWQMRIKPIIKKMLAFVAAMFHATRNRKAATTQKPTEYPKSNGKNLDESRSTSAGKYSTDVEGGHHKPTRRGSKGGKKFNK